MIAQTDSAPALTPTIAIRQNTFDPSVAGSSQLCLELSPDRFRFCVMNTDGPQPDCFWLEDYAFPTLLNDNPLLSSLKSIYENHPVLQTREWKRVRVSVNTPYFTLIPSVLYRKEYAAQYLRLMQGSALPAGQQTQTYVHADENFHSVFSLETPLVDWLRATYPLQEMDLMHQTSALIRATAGRQPQADLLLYFENEYVTIVDREKGSLKFCNKFAYKNASDLTYYVLYVLNELQLDPAKAPVVLFGEITPFSDTYISLDRFVTNLSFGATPQAIRFSPDFSELPDHRYVSLFGLGLFDV